MSRNRLAHVSADEAQRLRTAGVSSASELLAAAGNLPALVASSGLSAHRLAELVGAAAERAAAGVVRPADRRLWGPVRYLGLVGLVAFAALAAWMAAGSVSAAIGSASHVAMVAVGRSGLQAYEIIRPEDLVTVRGRPVTGAFSGKADVVGRYAVEAMAPGTVLARGDVSGRPMSPYSLDGRTVLSLPLHAPPVTVPLLPQAALVYASPTVAGAPGSLVVPDALVLAVRREAGAAWASIALQPDAAARLNGVLGTSGLTLAFPSPAGEKQ